MRTTTLNSKVVSILLTIVMLLSMLPIAVHAEEPTTYYVSVNSATSPLYPSNF